MILDPVSDLRHLRNQRSDWLLTVLTGVLILLIFVFAPLQAVGITAFHLFAIGLSLVIIGSMVIISNSPTALILMSTALVASIAVLPYFSCDSITLYPSTFIYWQAHG